MTPSRANLETERLGETPQGATQVMNMDVTIYAIEREIWEASRG